MHQRVRRHRGRPCRQGSGPQLLTSRRGERQVAADVEHVLQAARQIDPSDLRQRPQDVAEEHGGESGQQQHRDAPAAGIGQQQHPEDEQQHAVQCKVPLTERLREQVDLGRRRGRADDQQPEERAESDDEDRAVEGEPLPGHPHRPGADQEPDRGEDRRVEGDVEHVGDARERIAAAQPGRRPDDRADQIQGQGDRHASPGGLERAARKVACRRGGDDGGGQVGRPVGQQAQIVLDRGSAEARHQPRRGGGDIDGQGDHESVHPHEIGAVGRREHALNSSVIWPRVCMTWHRGAPNRPVARSRAHRPGRYNSRCCPRRAHSGKERPCRSCSISSTT